jgi:hypothetical protein
MLMLKIRAACAGVLFAASTYSTCGPSAPPQPPVLDVVVPPLPPEDAGAPLDDQCARSCADWQRLHCPEGDPSPAGVPCVVVCRNALDAGIDTAKQLSCADTAPDCTALRACPFSP